MEAALLTHDAAAGGVVDNNYKITHTLLKLVFFSHFQLVVCRGIFSMKETCRDSKKFEKRCVNAPMASVRSYVGVQSLQDACPERVGLRSSMTRSLFVG